MTRITLTLTDDERRAISLALTGKKRPATRAQVTDFVQRLVAAVIDPALAGASTIVVEHDDRGEHVTTFDPRRLTCTSLDHLYALGPKTPDTTCYCGQRKWGAFTPAKGGAQ